jgi:hypothetical protein
MARKNFKGSSGDGTGKDIVNRYLSNHADDGRFGRSFEVMFRKQATNIAHRVHPMTVADVVIGRMSIECKTGCGWLVNPEFDTKDDAIEYFESTKYPMMHASFVAYLPKWDGTNEMDALILPQRRFLKCLAKNNLVRAKAGSNGLWGISIQSYIPTPTFKASKERYESFMNDLFDNGEYLDSFIERLGIGA